MSRTDLEYHKSMAVGGRNDLIINDNISIEEVIPFTPDYEPMHQRPIVDASITHRCERTEERCTHLQLDMGMHVRATPKFQVEDPSIHGHSLHCLN